MRDDEFERLRAKHAGLLARCKGGPQRTVPVSAEKLRKSEDEHAFCAVCAANRPELDAALKLYGWQDQFAQDAPPPPAGDESGAQTYLEACAAWVRAEAQRIPAERMLQTAREALLAFGAHFSGKLVNSNAQHASLLAPARVSTQPHVSSRSLRAAGIALPLDQSKLDNRGLYQRVVKVLAGDPVMQGAAIPAEHLEAIRQGAAEAIEEAGSKSASRVDHRLRQVLLPTDGRYIAVSPLPAAGLAALWHEHAAAYEQPPSSKPLPASAAGKLAEPPRGRKPQKVLMPVGGAIVRNTTLLPEATIQTQRVFHVPQRRESVRVAWRFVYRRWKPRVSAANAQAAAHEIDRLSQSAEFGNSASLGAVTAQAGGALARLVADCHHQATQFARDIGEAPFVEDGAEIQIDEALLQRKRTSEITAIDRAILRQSFDAEYRKAMAESIALALRTRTLRADGTDVLMRQADRERVIRAIEHLLERT